MNIKDYVSQKYPNFKYDSYTISDNTINLKISLVNEKGICPCCKEISSHIHKYHKRVFCDTQCNDKSVITTFDCPVFKCKNPECSNQFFIHNYSFIGKAEKYSKDVINRIIDLV